MGKSKQARAAMAAAGTKLDRAKKAPGAEQDSAGVRCKEHAARATVASGAQRPPLLRRLIAFCIDWYVGSVLINLPIMAALHLANAPAPAVPDLSQLAVPQAVAACCVSALLAVAYYVGVPLKWHGATMGKRLCGVRIVSASGGEASVGALVMRQVVGTMVVEGSLITITAFVLQLALAGASELRQAVVLVQYVITGISALLVVVTRRRTALHDFMGGTQVVLA